MPRDILRSRPTSMICSRRSALDINGSRFLKDFPQREIMVVVDAPTPELVDQASAKLAASSARASRSICAVSQPGSGSFFERNGLLFLPTADVARLTTG